MSTGGSRKVPLCLQVENFCPNYWLQKKCTIRKNGNTHVQKRGGHLSIKVIILYSD